MKFVGFRIIVFCVIWHPASSAKVSAAALVLEISTLYGTGTLRTYVIIVIIYCTVRNGMYFLFIVRSKR